MPQDLVEILSVEAGAGSWPQRDPQRAQCDVEVLEEATKTMVL